MSRAPRPIINETDGRDFPRRVDELVPGEATGVEDIVLRFEAPVREPVVAHGYVAGSNAVLALIRTGDLAMEEVAANMPGTGKERSNWHRKLRMPVPTLFALPSAHVAQVWRKRDKLNRVH